ncbi:MAG: hypothetical protein ACI9S8_000497 [Chlamydiales bacterium]|jgi:hypothetical protein
MNKRFFSLILCTATITAATCFAWGPTSTDFSGKNVNEAAKSAGTSIQKNIDNLSSLTEIVNQVTKDMSVIQEMVQNKDSETISVTIAALSETIKSFSSQFSAVLPEEHVSKFDTLVKEYNSNLNSINSLIKSDQYDQLICDFLFSLCPL